MTELNVIVHHRFLHMPPRKVRAVLNLIRNKPVRFATAQLLVSTKRAARPVQKLLRSGIAAAKQKLMNEEQLIIAHATADQGPRLKRFFARSRGRTMPYAKQMSHVHITLQEQSNVQNKRLKIKNKKDQTKQRQTEQKTNNFAKSESVQQVPTPKRVGTPTASKAGASEQSRKKP